ncbi:hypothetical protein AGRI_06965 [Alishewanella agri BL06]|uniref:Uncharacterized protein n=1 Tax=Alishewanella agri BL06 TaxID=1195246 RepID=I8UBA2_9ALTE|nr:hypothetical protein AGRI_06965 [Alishewanella agri BL06]
MLVSACWDQARLLDQKNRKNESAAESLLLLFQNLPYVLRLFCLKQRKSTCKRCFVWKGYKVCYVLLPA